MTRVTRVVPWLLRVLVLAMPVALLIGAIRAWLPWVPEILRVYAAALS